MYMTQMSSILPIVFLLINFYRCHAKKVQTPDANEILPYTCSPKLDPGECRWSERTSCYSPIGVNIRQNFKALVDDLKEKNCQPPDQFFYPIVEDLLVEYLNKLFVGALRKNIEKTSKNNETICGACAVKVKCCNKAADFLSQALDAKFCDEGRYKKACVMPRIEAFELFQHHSKYKDWKHLTANPCDYQQFVAPIHHIIKGLTDNYGSLLNRTFCSIFGTLGHTMNCIKSKDKCLCCCNQYKPTRDGICVEDRTWRVDQSCERLEHESQECKRPEALISRIKVEPSDPKTAVTSWRRTSSRRREV